MSMHIEPLDLTRSANDTSTDSRQNDTLGSYDIYIT